jgi:XRE family aerobic/anaerobic benzoate catabolism transcriptional regulator
MSSTILHLPDNRDDEAKNPFLVALGDRVRALRARRSLSRKAVAAAADVSERHLANLEYGTGNASILVLLQVAEALGCPLAELIGDVTTSSPEWLMIRELLEHRDEATLRRIRESIGETLGTGGANTRRSPRVALIGLRGAGKSTLGKKLAQDLDYPFVELSREIEKTAGCGVAEIQALYGMNAYRRYERRALEEAIQIYPEAVIATPGGLVSEPASTEAMDDLQRILAGRAPFYSTAELKLDTSAQPLDPTFQALRRLVRDALQLPA